MSLIICYTGSNGSVIVGDKRRIGFFGNEKKRELLEKELYSLSIKTKEALLKRAGELDITLKITDDAEKVRELGDVVVGEVKTTTPFETKRKRIYQKHIEKEREAWVFSLKPRRASDQRKREVVRSADFRSCL